MKAKEAVQALITVGLLLALTGAVIDKAGNVFGPVFEGLGFILIAFAIIFRPYALLELVMDYLFPEFEEVEEDADRGRS